MVISLSQSILLSLLAVITGIDAFIEGFFIFRPIIVGTLTGLILGDLQTGVICGGLTELAYAGLTPVGGTQPPNPVIAGIMGPVLVYVSSGMTPVSAVPLTLPFALIMQYVILFFYSTFSFLMPASEKAASSGNVKKLAHISWFALALVGLSYAVVIFLSTYVAQKQMGVLVNSMPAWLINGFNVAGGILPAVGFALLLKVTLKKSLVPYLIIGVIFTTFIDTPNLLPVAALGLAFALLSSFSSMKKSAKEEEISHDGI